jgi:hypothetical protein
VSDNENIRGKLWEAFAVLWRDVADDGPSSHGWVQVGTLPDGRPLYGRPSPPIPYELFLRPRG